MRFALLGERLAHSYSALLHQSYGLDYQLHEVPKEELADFAAHCPYDGYNVTVPYKQAIIPLLDGLDDRARKLGAVNTVKIQDGRRIGYNTDYDGFLGALYYFGVDVRGKNALVLGSGGASAVVQAVLKDLGATVCVVSRKGPVNYQNCDGYRADILVNATPVGTHPNLDDAPIDLQRLVGLQFVYDLVYNPKCTALVYQARRLGIPAANGLTMLVIQALAARELWLGIPYTQEDMERCLVTVQQQTDNIALIGMPSSGKSTIGQRLADRLNRPFVDTDKMIEQKTRQTCEAIICTQGEAAFRAIEEEVVREACCLRGIVLALGGGSILSEASRRRLKQTATVVWLQRDLVSLQSTGRPTLQAQGAQAMYQARRPLYESTADYVVANDTVEQTVTAVMDAIH